MLRGVILGHIRRHAWGVTLRAHTLGAVPGAAVGASFKGTSGALGTYQMCTLAPGAPVLASTIEIVVEENRGPTSL